MSLSIRQRLVHAGVVSASGISGEALFGTLGGIVAAFCAMGALWLSILQNSRAKRREIEQEKRQREVDVSNAYERGRRDERRYQDDLRRARDEED